jgi:hypothetical protein
MALCFRGENMMNRWYAAALLLLLTVALISCTTDATEPDSQLTIPTAVTSGGEQLVAAPTNTFSALPAPPTIVVVETPKPGSTRTPEPTESPAIVTREPLYQVAFVEPDDVLNVRSGPGADSEIVGSLAVDVSGIRIVGPGQESEASTWVPIAVAGTAGWVNSRFLSEILDEAAFCDDEAVQLLLDELKMAVAEKDGDALSRLVHPERGLRIRKAWWNPEVWISGNDVEDLMASREVYEWGVEDGSGEAIEGSFARTMLPLLEEDLLPAEEVACNEILHGGTAGLVQLPKTYEGIDFYSFHRPGTDEYSGLDWGTWVIGVEKWQGEYSISYLLHFEWEI